jgi:hypothetical protein
VELDLVDQTRREVLVDDRGPSSDVDVLVARGLPCLRKSGLDSVGDEAVGGVGEPQRLALVMGDDEDGLVEWGILTPPALP